MSPVYETQNSNFLIRADVTQDPSEIHNYHHINVMEGNSEDGYYWIGEIYVTEQITNEQMIVTICQYDLENRRVQSLLLAQEYESKDNWDWDYNLLFAKLFELKNDKVFLESEFKFNDKVIIDNDFDLMDCTGFAGEYWN